MIEWLSADQVAQINAYQVAAFGGIQGIRDAGALESAVFPPQNAHAYTGAGLFECAALYAERFSRSQAFLDGNKRPGCLPLCCSWRPTASMCRQIPTSKI